jgi:AraC-like DNA-binding protein
VELDKLKSLQTVAESDKLNTKQPVEELDKLNSLQPVVELEKISSLTQMADDDRQFLLKVVDFVNVNMKARKITVDLLAQEMCMSRSQLARRLTALTGESPNIFITNVRMERARRLLKSTNMSVNEIAYECGYDEASYFIRVFRQELGMTPQQYRNMPIAG